MIRVRASRRMQAAGGPARLSVDFELAPGEICALFGPSGAGKTTLLRILAGLADPEEGRIEAEGRLWLDTASGVRLPPQERRVGLVFQDYALFPNMTVEENLRFALRPGEDGRIVGELLELAGLAGLAGRRPAQLSGGQRQRAALARALVQRPPLLLLDEPLSALDEETRLRLQEELLALHARFEMTVLLVSHDVPEIFRLARRVLRLEDGAVAADGPPETALADRAKVTARLLEGVIGRFGRGEK